MPAARAKPKAQRRAALPSARVERFFSRHLRHLKGRWAGQPFTLEKWQRDDVVVPLFDTLGRDRLRVYREALVGVARKNGKSSLASGLALYGTFADGYYNAAGEWQPEYGAEVYSVAGSKDQARIVFGVARDMVLASPVLRAASRVFKDAIEVPETGGVYRVLAADARLAHGYNPSMAVIDELHVHPSSDLYDALATGTAARRQPLIISITTAGVDRASICYRLYEAGHNPKRSSRFMFRWYEAPADTPVDDTKAMRAANPSKWVTLEFLRAQRRAPGMHEAVYRRLHLNQWTGSEERWIPTEDWDACGLPPALEPGDTIWVGVDAAAKRDTTAVVIDRRDTEGTHHVVARVWEADRQMGYLDFGEVEDYLRGLCIDYDVRRILVDPYVMMRSMILLSEEGLPIEEYPQNDARMVPASQTLYDLALEHRIRHGGDRTLRAHADNAAVRETSRGWRLHKLKSTGKIDALVALAMAAHIAEQDAGDTGPNVIVSRLPGM